MEDLNSKNKNIKGGGSPWGVYPSLLLYNHGIVLDYKFNEKYYSS